MIWHDEKRVRLAGGIILIALCWSIYACFVLSLWNFSTMRTNSGLPLAPDFANYWAASKLALSGKAELVYHIQDLHNVEQQILGSHHRPGIGWYYPPTFLLVVLPFGAFPYWAAVFIWIFTTLVIYMAVLYRISSDPLTFPFCLSFPGIYVNFIYCQNGYLSGILLGGGLLCLDRYPVIAGCLLGLLTYKPNLAMVAFIGLIFGRYWKALMASITTALLFIILSIVAFGYHTWLAYFQVMSIPMHQLEVGQAPWRVMPTFFAAMLSAGFGINAAYLVQGVMMLVAVGGIAWVWRKRASLPERGAVLVVGTLLFTPYAFMSDLAILALPLCWLWEEGRLGGRLPGERLLLLAGWLMPIGAPVLWNELKIFPGHLQIGPAIITGLFLLALIKSRYSPRLKNIEPD